MNADTKTEPPTSLWVMAAAAVAGGAGGRCWW
jgi:hypothetical protein